MTDEQRTVERDAVQQTTEADAVTPAAEPAPDPFEERPEIFVGAALAGGFLLAMVMRRLAR